ncbi:hypothetical protein [Nocardia farcinica]|uniref:hypothetical protein n=1 Tax=Nocardia farcinica TaxID=37329 RepID=UPI00189564EB|nr:hypothetical protein [Nocardia farcinica]MBF6410926.1 hypothetical protein [Nocardia farcinica]
MNPDHFRPGDARNVEPSAHARTFATTTFDYFTALTQAGFTERQALAVIGSFLAALTPREGDK